MARPKTTEKPNELPSNVSLVQHPIEVPTAKKQPGIYAGLLDAATRLKRTTAETGLSPHFEWQCKTREELKKVMGSLLALRRRRKDDYRRIGLMQRLNSMDSRFTIYIWNQE